MATAARGSSEEGFQKWKDGIDRASGDWNAYDGIIRFIVMDYNQHLADTPRFNGLDWRIVKAMLWTETGPHAVESWRRRPLRIGVSGDPGLRALLGGREGGDLVMPPSLRISFNSAQQIARDNLAAGVGYLLMRMADFGFATVPDEDAAISEFTVRRGDSLSKIATACGSTITTLQKLNPGTTTLQQGQVLKCQKASVQKVITGWKTFDYRTIARRYNGNGDPKGDPLYARKLEYAMNAIRSRGQ